MLLKKVKINKYKSFLTEQSIDIEKDVTRIVGKNESGKTAILEALAKFNHFEKNENCKFDATFDYPRSEFIEFDKTDKNFNVVTCDFELSKELLTKISEECGENIIDNNFTLSITYNNTFIPSNITVYFENFIKKLINKYKITEEIKNNIVQCLDFNSLLNYCEKEDTLKDVTNELKRIVSENKIKEMSDPLTSYIYSKYIYPNIPKFWYFDEYFSLPSRIDLTELSKDPNTNKYSYEQKNIINALFDLSNLKIKEVVDSKDFERFIATLEATSNKITDTIFEYWTTNKNLEIDFEREIDATNGNKILNIRIKNKKHRVTLPLRNRSKGFIWFFSFLVWFSRIQGEKDCKYILLLDEPGLNLHAAAQKDLLVFINKELASKYQVIYTTHSPFMINSESLNQVRTVYDSQDSKDGSIISEAIQEKDPDTLFPLQAALGYDIAQNLYISKNNLIVEGVSDLIFLESISEYLKELGKIGLDENITIVPTGGLDKVVSFISLLRGSKLNIVCLLDNFIDSNSEERLNILIKEKIIKDKNILFFGDFAKLKNNKADLEDMFNKNNYISLFNIAFNKDNIKIDIKDIKIENRILPQIKQILKEKYNRKDGYNHYKPANEFLKSNEKNKYLDEETIVKFEDMFKKINDLFNKQ